MMKQEFEQLIGGKICDENYSIVEVVYATHPSISAENGKVEIANIYKLPGGMRIIKDMVPTAAQMAELIDEATAARSRMSEIEARIAELKA